MEPEIQDFINDLIAANEIFNQGPVQQQFIASFNPQLNDIEFNESFEQCIARLLGLNMMRGPQLEIARDLIRRYLNLIEAFSGQNLMINFEGFEQFVAFVSEGTGLEPETIRGGIRNSRNDLEIFRLFINFLITVGLINNANGILVQRNNRLRSEVFFNLLRAIVGS